MTSPRARIAVSAHEGAVAEAGAELIRRWSAPSSAVIPMEARGRLDEPDGPAAVVLLIDSTISAGEVEAVADAAERTLASGRYLWAWCTPGRPSAAVAALLGRLAEEVVVEVLPEATARWVDLVDGAVVLRAGEVGLLDHLAASDAPAGGLPLWPRLGLDELEHSLLAPEQALSQPALAAHLEARTRALGHLRRGNVGTARRHLEATVTTVDDDWVPLYLLARIASDPARPLDQRVAGWAKRAVDLARFNLERSLPVPGEEAFDATRARERLAASALLFARLLRRGGRTGEAAELLHLAERYRPGDLDAAVEAVRIAVAAEDHAGAVRRAAALLDRAPEVALAVAESIGAPVQVTLADRLETFSTRFGGANAVGPTDSVGVRGADTSEVVAGADLRVRLARLRSLVAADSARLWSVVEARVTQLEADLARRHEEHAAAIAAIDEAAETVESRLAAIDSERVALAHRVDRLVDEREARAEELKLAGVHLEQDAAELARLEDSHAALVGATGWATLDELEQRCRAAYLQLERLARFVPDDPPLLASGWWQRRTHRIAAALAELHLHQDNHAATRTMEELRRRIIEGRRAQTELPVIIARRSREIVELAEQAAMLDARRAVVVDEARRLAAEREASAPQPVPDPVLHAMWADWSAALAEAPRLLLGDGCGAAPTAPGSVVLVDGRVYLQGRAAVSADGGEVLELQTVAAIAAVAGMAGDRLARALDVDRRWATPTSTAVISLSASQHAGPRSVSPSVR